MIDLDAEQIQEIADDLMFYAATESGFSTDGESFFLSSEKLTEMKDGNDFNLTEILDDFSYHFIFKLMEFNELQKHQGVTQ